MHSKVHDFDSRFTEKIVFPALQFMNNGCKRFFYSNNQCTDIQYKIVPHLINYSMTIKGEFDEYFGCFWRFLNGTNEKNKNETKQSGHRHYTISLRSFGTSSR